MLERPHERSAEAASEPGMEARAGPKFPRSSTVNGRTVCGLPSIVQSAEFEINSEFRW